MDDATSPQGGFSSVPAAGQPQSHSLSRPLRQQGGLARVLYTNNPFYLISAWLVFSGLRVSFDSGGEMFETWALIGGLAGYALLAAVAAGVLIRLGRVWEDIRTLVLLVLLMFLAIAVSLDEALVKDARRGAWFLIGGLIFAASLRVRSGWWRLQYNCTFRCGHSWRGSIVWCGAWPSSWQR